MTDFLCQKLRKCTFRKKNIISDIFVLHLYFLLHVIVHIVLHSLYAVFVPFLFIFLGENIRQSKKKFNFFFFFFNFVTSTKDIFSPSYQNCLNFCMLSEEEVLHTH